MRCAFSWRVSGRDWLVVWSYDLLCLSPRMAIRGRDSSVQRGTTLPLHCSLRFMDEPCPNSGRTPLGLRRVVAHIEALRDRGMFSCEFLVAVSLLLQPADTPESAPAPEMFNMVRLALQTLAVEWEILDQREVRYVLARAEDFTSDLNLLRRRYAELEDAPHS